ncbi:MAG: nickel pincer cofactor biosynthesis protein LarB, partial [Spirochaetaceae bacterium]|jgi:NCAIR mutase (PurE)-related protein|nr:nickel pincer cofactor biosynthesis protein LarB [Spirochaetaceae bacterium]
MSDDLEFAFLDSRRAERTASPEVVYCAGKTVEQAEAIITRMREKGIPVLATRAKPDLAQKLKKRFNETHYDEISGILSIGQPGKICPEDSPDGGIGLVAVVCAGTSDLYAAREALLSAEFLGSKTTLICDVGVAGIHRLFARLDEIKKARVVVVAAGMDGALPSVIAGLVSIPVIALPTSVGYGASFGGLSALLAMLNACAPGVAVVNIDNGFGAGYLANQINQAANRKTE